MNFEAKNLVAGYGDVTVLWGVDLHVAQGEIVALIGSNGAGKTTLMKCLSGLLQPRSGELLADGVVLADRSPRALLKAGVAHVPEGRRLFRGMSVEDNLSLGAYLRTDAQAVKDDLAYVFSLFPILKSRRTQDASTLSGGEQQMCAIGRGIMARPRLLLIDELSLGLSPKVAEELAGTLHDIARRDVGILLVEQDVSIALEISSRGYVIERGKVAAEAPSATLLRMPIIEDAYLGVM
jgi:branched-chain amino acid transport system ATP-binding protein